MPVMPSLAFLAPLVLLLAAVLATANPGRRPGTVPRISELAALFALLLSAGGLALIVAGKARARSA